MSPDMDRWLTWHYYTQGSEAFKGDLHFYSVDHDLRDELQNIDGHKCPVVMLTGDYDYLTPPEATEDTARQIKGAVYIEMKDIGHFPMSENHEVFRVYLIEALKIIKERTGYNS
jgi:pimeloyl-ACP methyl ester carboxylesterase